MLRKILFERRGENATSEFDPVGEWHEGMVDLTAEVTCCYAFDNDMLVRVNRYDVREVDLPEWLSADEWARHSIEWRYTWGMGVSRDLPEAWARKLLSLNSLWRYVCAKLLKTKKFRSEFRASMRSHLEDWLNGVTNYPSPFSPRMFDCLCSVYDKRDHDRTAENLYWRRSDFGAPVRHLDAAELTAAA